jgi:hypothetical protein
LGTMPPPPGQVTLCKSSPWRRRSDAEPALAPLCPPARFSHDSCNLAATRNTLPIWRTRCIRSAFGL